MKVLVTGTSKGIGKSIATKFLEEGHDVIGFDILEGTINNKNYTHYIQDICNELPDIEDIDILVNNAGIQEGEVIKVNLEGTINVTEKYINPNIKSIVFITSTSATTGSEFPEYVASKGGVLAYMKNVALRISKYKATANSISPGGVITELNSHILNDEKLYKAVLDETLLDKWAEPEEIADFVYFVSVINKSMTGEDIIIDNGEKLKSNFIW
ncbi:MAG: SDR family oxidoreductase [Bacilli bacterium]|nr:SDR family oxidoreductase [Bacilli bacterium]